jgi:outer membrane protein OmpA-like peptidoglycan-associated protein
VTVILSGCATQRFVREEVGRSEQTTAAKLAEVQSEVEKNRESAFRLGEISARHEDQIADVSETAREALDRAIQAGKLARGKFIWQVELTDDAVSFPFESAALGDEALAALDRFAAQVVARDENVFVEIQGHTDSTGPADYNRELGLERAESVMRYLNEKHRFPLHRMDVISYGSERPLADNATRDGRSKNRRVTLVVLS